MKMGQWLCRVPPPLHAHRGCNVHPPSPRRMQWTDESLRPLGPSHAWGHQEHEAPLSPLSFPTPMGTTRDVPPLWKTTPHCWHSPMPALHGHTNRTQLSHASLGLLIKPQKFSGQRLLVSRLTLGLSLVWGERRGGVGAPAPSAPHAQHSPTLLRAVHRAWDYSFNQSLYGNCSHTDWEQGRGSPRHRLASDINISVEQGLTGAWGARVCAPTPFLVSLPVLRPWVDVFALTSPPCPLSAPLAPPQKAALDAHRAPASRPRQWVISTESRSAAPSGAAQEGLPTPVVLASPPNAIIQPLSRVPLTLQAPHPVLGTISTHPWLPSSRPP